MATVHFPNIENILNQHIENIRTAAILGTLASGYVHGYVSDDISENQACKTYGSGWIKLHTKKGRLHYYRNGSGDTSTKIYSRFEIETLKRAEKHVSTAYGAALEELLEAQNK